MIDFDKTTRIRSGNHDYLCVWVVCDQCGFGRWNQKANALVLKPGQLCKSCSMSQSSNDRRVHVNGERKCSRCGVVYPLSMFTRRKDRIDSFRSRCRNCLTDLARLQRENNPDKSREIKRQAQRLRRARKHAAGGVFTNFDWNEILGRYNHRCLSCGSTEDLQPDHVIPLSVGGTNDKSNIQPLCGLCNRKKQAQVIDYRQSVYALI
jgi:5-methylcytosine-specific restriction endonuclease McrA